MSTVDVMLCVGHPDNGAETGRIDGVEVGEIIRLEGPIDWMSEDMLGETTFSRAEETITIGGVAFFHRGYSMWVGNWCWDQAALEPAEALRLLNHLKANKWDCQEAVAGLFDRWCHPGDLTMEDLARAGLDVPLDSGRPS